MHDPIDHIFNQACRQLREGKSLPEILSQWPGRQRELESLLAIAAALGSLPKHSVPEPAMQRKYILAPSRRLWVNWLHLSRWSALSMSLLLFAAILGGTGYAAEQSVPGDALFSLKKAAEHLQLQMASNPEDKLKLQVAIAQKRLNYAQTVVDNPLHNPQQETAALNELADETMNTANAISQATQNQTSSAAASQDHPLIATLNSITAQQETLLKKLTAQNNGSISKDLLSDARASTAKVAELNQTLAAASNDTALTRLPAGAASSTASSTIAAGITASSTASSSLTGEVKGTEVMGSTASAQYNGSKTAAASATGTPDQAAQDPNTAIGSFIIEDPLPQMPQAGPTSTP